MGVIGPKPLKRSRSKVSAQIELENMSPPRAIAGPANLWVAKRGCDETSRRPRPLKILIIPNGHEPTQHARWTNDHVDPVRTA